MRVRRRDQLALLHHFLCFLLAKGYASCHQGALRRGVLRLWRLVVLVGEGVAFRLGKREERMDCLDYVRGVEVYYMVGHWSREVERRREVH